MSTSRNNDIVVCLKNTSKGRLVYDRSRHVTQKFLDECSSPPELSCFHDESRYRYVNPNYKLKKQQQQQQEKGDEEKQERKEESSHDNSCGDSGSLDIEKLKIKTSPRKPALMVSPDFARSVKSIKEYEQSCDNRIKDVLEKKAKEFQTHSSELQQKAEKQLKELERRNIMKALQVQETTLQQHRKGKDESAKVHLKMQEDHRKHAQMLERKHEKIQEEIRKKEQEKKEREEKLKQLLTDLKTVQSRILAIQPKCAVQNKLADQCKLIVERIRKTATDLENHVMHETQSGEINQSLPDKLKDAVMFALNAYEAITKRIEEENQKIEEEKAKAAAAAEAKRLEEEAKAAAAAAPVATSTPIASSSDKNRSALTAGISPVAEASSVTQLAENEIQCVDVEAFQWYTKLQDNLKKTEDLIKALSSPESKKLKFDLQKAVNTPINAISAVSGEHLREKLKRLLDLMSGQSVEVGSKRVSTNAHPQALTFCKYLAAKMIVKKGDEQVSSKHETAFATAMVFVGLWMEHPDIGDLFLGHLHSACPYTVPYYIPRQEGQSTEDYHKALGYRYNSDGNVEKQDQFLKRMSGMMRLYAAILVAPAPPLRGSFNDHPYGVENAWIWLSRVMNIQPHPDITATMIYDMLHVAGNALYARYGKQFQKLLYMLIKEYLPKLKQVASASGGGPLTRLETFLETSLKHNRHIPNPDGFLQADFWLSS